MQSSRALKSFSEAQGDRSACEPYRYWRGVLEPLLCT
jgi:hypothetical protein